MKNENSFICSKKQLKLTGLPIIYTPYPPYVTIKKIKYFVIFIELFCSGETILLIDLILIVVLGGGTTVVALHLCVILLLFYDIHCFVHLRPF